MPIDFKKTRKAIKSEYEVDLGSSGSISVFIALLRNLGGLALADKSAMNLYQKSNDIYHNGKGNSPITDDEFDELRAYLLKRKAVVKTIGAKHSKSEEIELPYPLPSLEFVRTTPEMVKWAEKHAISRLLVTPKYDGISLYLRYRKGKFEFAATRGDGLFGKDVTRHALLAPCVPKRLKEKISCEVRCEIFLPESIFQSKFSIKSGGKFKTSRNAVSGTFGRNNPNVSVLQHMDCRVFEVFNSPIKESGVAVKEGMLTHMGKLGLPVTDYILLNINPLFNLDKLFDDWSAKYDVLMDGLVCESHVYYQRKQIGLEASSNPAYARAFKPLKEAVQTKVLAIGYSVSKDNYVKPTIVVKPVEIGGVTVSNVNGHNAGNMRDKGIGPGAVITISRRGDTIPHLETVEKPVKWEKPTSFGPLRWTVNDKGEKVDLVATESGDEHKIQMLVQFFEAMGVEYFNEGNVRKFYKNRLTTIPMILEASATFLEANIPGVKEKSANRIRWEFDKLRNVGVTMPKLMYASGCFGRGFGEDKLQKIYDRYGDQIFTEWNKLKISDIAQHVGAVKGFTEKTGEAFAHGLHKFKQFQKDIGDLVKIKTINKKGKLLGQTVVFTEFRDEELKELIKTNGGKYSNSLVKDTTILLKRSPQVESKKTAEAQKLGIKIMTIVEFQTQYKLKG